MNLKNDIAHDSEQDSEQVIYLRKAAFSDGTAVLHIPASELDKRSEAERLIF